MSPCIAACRGFLALSRMAPRWLALLGVALLPGCMAEPPRQDGKLEWSLTIETKKVNIGANGARSWQLVSNQVIPSPTTTKIQEEVAKLDWSNAELSHRVTIGYKQHEIIASLNSDTAVFIEGTLGGLNEYGPLRAFWFDQKPDLLVKNMSPVLTSVDEAIRILQEVKSLDESFKTSVSWTNMDAPPAPAAGTPPAGSPPPAVSNGFIESGDGD